MVISTSPLVRTYSLEEFWNLPDPVDASKLELIKGVLYMTPPPDAAHNEVASSLLDRLTEEIRRCGYQGRVYVPRAARSVDEDTHLEPDLFYISAEMAARMDRRHLTAADLVVEILSPSNAVYDRTTKSDTYRAMGVRELWLVDTEARTVEVRSFAADRASVYHQRDVLRSEVLPKIEIPVSAVCA